MRDLVDALEAGADDYIERPVHPDELVARVRSLARRQPDLTARPLFTIVDDLVIDWARWVAYRDDRPLNLTPKELSMLELMSRRVGRVVTRAEFLAHCWDAHTDPLSNVVDVHMAALRRKVGDPPLVHTVRGRGYALDARP